MTTRIIKKSDETLRQVTFIAMVEGVDAHGDYTSLETIRKAKESFNLSKPSCNLFHMWNTENAVVIESYQAPVDMVIEDNIITKGTWLMTFQLSEVLWEMVVDGRINGISIGATGVVTQLEGDDDE